jgi:hypothetical protein
MRRVAIPSTSKGWALMTRLRRSQRFGSRLRLSVGARMFRFVPTGALSCTTWPSSRDERSGLSRSKSRGVPGADGRGAAGRPGQCRHWPGRYSDAVPDLARIPDPVLGWGGYGGSRGSPPKPGSRSTARVRHPGGNVGAGHCTCGVVRRPGQVPRAPLLGRAAVDRACFRPRHPGVDPV